MAALVPRSVILRLELERGAVDAVAQPVGPRSVGKDVAEMALAARAQHFGPDHAVRGIAEFVDHPAFGGLGEARPARAAVELVLAFEQRLAASGADILAGGLVVLILAGERALGPVL